MFAIYLRQASRQTCMVFKRHESFNHSIFSNKIQVNILQKYSLLLKDLQHAPQRNFSVQNILRQKAFDVNTNVQKDVILFKYENPKFFSMLNIFAIIQFFFWGYLGNFAYTCLRDAPPLKDNEEAPWWQRVNLGENKYRNGLTITCFTIGYGILAISWMYTLKSVRYLVLRKGGNSVTFVTYAPFGKNRMMTVDLKNVSSQEMRQNASVQLPIKVRNKYLYYLLDMKGEFKNTKLFDYTAGLKRIWK